MHLWHARLGHVNFQYLCLLFLLLKQAYHDCHFKFVICLLLKHTRSSYLPCINLAPTAFQIIHSDIWSPSPVTTVSGHRYYVTFIDDYTRCSWIYLLKKKSKFFITFNHFLQMIKTQSNTIVCHLRSDNDREYVFDEFHSELAKHGIL